MSNEQKFELGQEVTLKGVIKAVKTNNDDSVHCLVDIEGVKGAILNLGGYNPPSDKVWIDAAYIHPAAPTPQFNNGDWVEDLSGNRWTVVVDTTKQRYHLSRVNEHGDTERRVWTYQVGHEYFTKV